jgi:hypothetical protein
MYLLGLGTTCLHHVNLETRVQAQNPLRRGVAARAGREHAVGWQFIRERR